MQKTVIPSLTRSTDSETDDQGGVITAALCCGESVVRSNWHHIMFKPLYVDVILTYRSFNCHQWPTMRYN